MSSPKTRYHHGNLKAVLLDLAEQAIESHGFENLALQTLTQTVGVQPSAAYRHFRNRDALLRSLAQRGFDQWAEEMATLVATTPPRLRAETFSRFYLRFALQRPQMFRLMFVSEHGRDHRSISGMVSFLKYESTLQHLMPKADDELLRSRLLASWAMLHGMALLLIEGRIQRFYIGNMDDDAFIDYVMRRHLNLPAEYSPRPSDVHGQGEGFVSNDAPDGKDA